MRTRRPVLREELEADRSGFGGFQPCVGAAWRRAVPHEVRNESLRVPVPGEDVPPPCRVPINVEVAKALDAVEHLVVHQDLSACICGVCVGGYEYGMHLGR